MCEAADGYMILEDGGGSEEEQEEDQDSALDALMRDYDNTLAHTKTPKSLAVDSLLESLEQRVLQLERTILLLLIKQEESSSF